MKAYFCEHTGERLVAPGVSKSVDPKNGVDALDSSGTAPKATGSEPQPKDSGAKASSKKASE